MYTLGLDMGGTKCAGVLLDDGSNVIAQVRIPTPKGTDQVVQALIESARELMRQSPSPVAAVGCGVPGLITTAGTLRYAPHLSGVTQLPLQEILARSLNVPVTVANDNTCATWGEYTVDRNAKAFLYVGFGTGVGGGAVLNGELFFGSSGFSGEIGHMVVDANGPRCICGRNGCWEIYASGSGLGRLARARGLDLDGPGVRSLLQRGDPVAHEVVETFAQWVTVGLTNLIFVLDPDMIVLGGGAIGLPEEADELIDPIRRHLEVEFGGSGQHRELPPVIGARLGPLAGAVGAALLARETTEPTE